MEWGKAELDKQKAISKMLNDQYEREEKIKVKQQIENLESELDAEKAKVKKLENTLVALKSENNQYQNLLSKPFQEIAKVNGDFKAAYEKQQDVLADWILSQQAFKETATQFGIELGKSKDEIKVIVAENEMAVLENRTEHNNNADKYPTLAERREKILQARKR